MLLLIVHLEVVPGRLDELVEVANVVARESRGEPGCLAYGFYQDTGQPTSFVFVERYTNREALAHHRSQPYFATFKAQMLDLVRSRRAELLSVERLEAL